MKLLSQAVMFGLCLAWVGGGCGSSRKKRGVTSPHLQVPDTVEKQPTQPDADASQPTPNAVIFNDQEIRHVGGRLTIGGYSFYGNKAETQPSNWPGARKSAMNWKDQAGRFWLFGGEGLSEKNSGRLNDFWFFDPAIAQWTWMDGAKKPAAANTQSFPGSRTGAAAWTGPDGRLWLFGGFTQLAASKLGYSQDLWVFDTRLRQWSWVSGYSLDQPNQFHSASTPSTGVPAGRERAAYWTDEEGRLWLFGGQNRNLETGEIRRLNDLWSYNTEANVWTFVSGSRQPNAENSEQPSARDNAAAWVDSDGKFWLFGGFGFGQNSVTGHLNDLWHFDPKTKIWEFVSGSRDADAQGKWTAMIKADDGAYPSAREASLAWVRGQNICLFGGWGYSVYHFIGEPNALQDLWCFDTKGRQWTWMLGNNQGQERNYTKVQEVKAGSIGYPGARYGASHWIGSESEVFIFGGAGYDSGGRGDLLQDFWRLPLHKP